MMMNVICYNRLQKVLCHQYQHQQNEEEEKQRNQLISKPIIEILLDEQKKLNKHLEARRVQRNRTSKNKNY